MSKYFIFIGMILLTATGFAQTVYEKSIADFYRFYNDQTPDSIFHRSSPELQEKLPLEKTRAVMEGLHIQYGEWKSVRLLKTDSGFNIYKAVFSQQTLTLLFELSENGQIAGYRFRPYNPGEFDGKKNN